VTLAFSRPVTLNVIRIREHIRLGQRVGAFTIETEENGRWNKLADGTSVGSCRLIRLPREVTATTIRLRIADCPVCPALSEFAAFLS
jgi:alpha-L-fucosidase